MFDPTVLHEMVIKCQNKLEICEEKLTAKDKILLTHTTE